MKRYPGKIESMQEERRGSTAVNHGVSPGKINASCSSMATRKLLTKTTENEVLRICQALLLSTCVALLSYHSVRYGRTEYSILENGQIVRGYTHKAVVNLSLGHSVPYSLVSFVATGMLAYSLVSKRPRWSLPSIVLYLADLICDVSDAIVAVWMFFANFPFTTAVSYTTGAVLLILGEIWIWLGVLRLYEHRTFK